MIEKSARERRKLVEDWDFRGHFRHGRRTQAAASSYSYSCSAFTFQIWIRFSSFLWSQSKYDYFLMFSSFSFYFKQFHNLLCTLLASWLFLISRFSSFLLLVWVSLLLGCREIVGIWCFWWRLTSLLGFRFGRCRAY